MIKWEKRVLSVHYLEQGLLVAAIARELGVDRRTVHRWKAAGELQPSSVVQNTRPRPPQVV